MECVEKKGLLGAKSTSDSQSPVSTKSRLPREGRESAAAEAKTGKESSITKYEATKAKRMSR